MDDLKRQCEDNIKGVEELFNSLERQGLLNEQFVLDWLDKLNEISVKA